MKVIIAGSRSLHLLPEFVEDIVHLSGFKVTELICGMARGVDKSAFTWAQEKNIPIHQYPYLSKYGKAGGYIRNKQMLDVADAAIFVIDTDWTPGTTNCYTQARKMKIPTYIYNLSGLCEI